LSHAIPVRLLGVTTGLAVLVLLVLFSFGWPDIRYASSFEEIKLGTNRESIEAKLGQPLLTSKDCHVAQFVEFERPPAWPQASTTAYCFHWIGPGHFGRFYAVGFSADNRVVGVAYGDS